MIHDGVSGNAGSSVGDRAREVSVVRVRGTAGRRRSDLLTVEEPWNSAFARPALRPRMENGACP